HHPRRHLRLSPSRPGPGTVELLRVRRSQRHSGGRPRFVTLSFEPGGGGLSLGLPVAGGASAAATATLRRLEGRDVALFRPAVDRAGLGGGPIHDTRTGVASLVAADEEDALLAVADLLSYLPANHVDDPPGLALAGDDPLDRPCRRAAAAVPDAARASYDVRTVLADVLDERSLLEVRA